ncbi:hypothetical protein RBB77_00195 [Tunturibacter psychrotolerans]|uniref:Uncharacterized protein n=1 Tax=Tunturiibacter psychrotolerans TaxID=3069686 RepID=A0AAU7ZQV1_9BACT
MMAFLMGSGDEFSAGAGDAEIQKNTEALAALLLPGDPQWHGAYDDETVPGSSKPNPVIM